MSDFRTGDPRPGSARSEPPRRRPTAIRLDEAEFVGAAPPSGDRPVIVPEAEDEPPPPPAPRRRGISWGTLFTAAAGGLVSLALGLALDALIRDLFTRAEWLGWLAAVLTALAVVAALAVIGREVLALTRLSAIESLSADAALAAAADDRPKAEAVVARVTALYAGRPETARGRAAMADHLAEVIDGRDLLMLAEREVLAPLDARARAMVVASARRVSVVTALSPRALIDLVYVAAEAASLTRRLSTLYGGRPGTLGFFRLARHVLGHLAVTGGLAATDGLVHEIVGRSVASRLSARLGEGIVNGLMTARVGLAAIDVCRPLPFMGTKRTTISEIVGDVAKLTTPPDGEPGKGPPIP
ncbi:TIGR01620 family protein [Pseudoxanthobacter sp. M-2]|uniref:YcjF family protein n=1 Tax=Pseudoxanthobacter sp. M-2 TaxID=3078754 RepID=UPI0038FD15E3